MRAKLGVEIRTDAREVSKSFKIRAALEVALIGRQDKTEVIPAWIDVLLLHRIEEPDQFTEGKRPTRGFLRKAEFSVVLVKQPVLDPRSCWPGSQANDVRCR